MTMACSYDRKLPGADHASTMRLWSACCKICHRGWKSSPPCLYKSRAVVLSYNPCLDRISSIVHSPKVAAAMESAGSQP